MANIRMNSKRFGGAHFGLGGCSESKIADGQVAAEAALMLMAETLGGANLIHDLGYLESGLCTSLAQLVICHDIIGWIGQMLAPAVVDEETLALDLIDEIGPDGQFLDTAHTRAHYREQWYPDVFERGDVTRWESAGSKDLGRRAAERVEVLLAEHTPEPLPADVARAVRAVVARAEEGAR